MQGCRLIHLCCLILFFVLIHASNHLQADSKSTTIGKLLRSEAVESSVIVNLNKTNASFNQQNINIHCFDGVVLLTGEVASNALKNQAGQIARKTKQVRQVHNHLKVARPASYLSRVNDSWLATKVRGKLMMDSAISTSNIWVTSNQGHIYLMGTLSKAQTKEAIKIAQQVEGVQGVTDLVIVRHQPSQRQPSQRAQFYLEQFMRN